MVPVRPGGPPARRDVITEAVLAAIQSFPFDREQMYEIAALRDPRSLDHDRVERHINLVQAEFAVEVERHLVRHGIPNDVDAKFLSSVMAQCVAAATFAALDTWMRSDHTNLDELTRLTELALTQLEHGLAALPRNPLRS